MPLKRLWNSLCGRSSETEAAAKPANGERADLKATKRAVTMTDANPPAPQPIPVKPRRSVLSMISRGEHDGLIKTIRQSKAKSILEIGVGDGSRMTAILSALVRPLQADPSEADRSDVEASSIKAAVIDQFEMGCGKIALRDYHRRLNGLSQRPVIFPEPIGRGLVSVANRLGKMDVVLIDAAVFESDDQQPVAELQATIAKVLHVNSVVLSNESGKWSVRTFDTDRTQSRAA